MKIGITGSIGCGKSVVVDYLKNNGFKTYDADRISYELTQKGNVCYNMIINCFGDEILNSVPACFYISSVNISICCLISFFSLLSYIRIVS